MAEIIPLFLAIVLVLSVACLGKVGILLGVRWGMFCVGRDEDGNCCERFTLLAVCFAKQIASC